MDETGLLISIVLALISPLMSVVGAYVGVRVGQARIEGRVTQHDKEIGGLNERVDRLEEPYFRRPGRD